MLILDLYRHRKPRKAKNLTDEKEVERNCMLMGKIREANKISRLLSMKRP